MSKKKYKVIVREVLEREIEIEEEGTFSNVADKVISMYEDEKIVLTADDCIGRDIFLNRVEGDRIKDSEDGFHIYSK